MKQKHLIERASPFTGKLNTMEMEFDPEDFKKWQNGMCVQDALPYLSEDEREFIISGIMPEEWDMIMCFV